MKLIALDLELNQNPSNPGKIIQIGVCVGDSESGLVLDSLSILINPEEQIEERITALTGITQVMVDQGVSLYDGYLMLKAFYEKYNPGLRNAVTWATSDCQYLRSQLKLNEDEFLFGRRWIDTKTIYQAYRMSLGLDVHCGLKKACHRMGMIFDGPAHNAEKDALNTFKLYALLLKKFTK